MPGGNAALSCTSSCLVETQCKCCGKDGATATDPPRAVYAESFYPLLHYGWSPLRVLRSTTHKYIESPNPELFDFAADPVGKEDALAKLLRLLRSAVPDLGANLDSLSDPCPLPDP